MNPFQMYNMYNTFAGGGSTTGGSTAGGGLGGAGIFAIIAAAIAAQHLAAQNTDTKIEGQRSGGVFSGNFATEPWLGFLSQEMGWEPTIGQKFDAAVKNKDWSKVAKRSFGAMDYWADPIRNWFGTGLRNTIGKWPAMFLEPISGLFSWLGD